MKPDQKAPPDIEAIAREAAEQIDIQVGAVRCDGSYPGPDSYSIIAAAIRRALEPGEKQVQTAVQFFSDFNELNRQLARSNAENDTLRLQYVEAVEVLKAVEWEACVGMVITCPWCHWPQAQGHNPACKLAKAIDKRVLTTDY